MCRPTFTALVSARVPYAMALAGLFFGWVARVRSRVRSPIGALIFQGALGALIALSGTASSSSFPSTYSSCGCS
jgi:amino acid transporter